MQPLPVGTKLQNGLYTVGRTLGQGGFGLIYFGSDTMLSRLVAVKELFPLGCARQGSQVLHGSVAPDAFERMKARFRAEAEALAQFRHANIVGVHSCFEENNTVYMVMEFIKGQTLQQLIEAQDNEPLSENDVRQILNQVADALAGVHARQLIHRDINPSNIMLCDDGRVVLIDFGLNRKVEEAGTYGTRQLVRTTALGTPGYAPLEQHGATARTGPYTDIYSLGATLYFCLTGSPPLEAVHRLDEELLPPHEVNRAISRGFSTAIMEALQIKSAARPQTVGEFLKLTDRACQAAAISHKTTTGPVKQVIATLPTAPPVQKVPTHNAPMSGLTPLRVFEGHEKNVWPIAFSRSGELLASGSYDGSVRLWNVESGECLCVLQIQSGAAIHSPTIRALAFSWDQELLAVGNLSGHVFLWDLKKEEVIQHHRNPNNFIHDLSFSPDNRFFTGSMQKRINSWDVATGQQVMDLSFDWNQFPSNITFASTGELMAADFAESGVTITQLKDRTQWPKVPLTETMSKYQSGYVYGAFSPDGKFLTIWRVDQADIFDLTTKQYTKSLPIDRSHRAIALCGESRLLASVKETSVYLWAY